MSDSTTPSVRSPPRGAVSTFDTSSAIGRATTSGHSANTSRAASFASSAEPKKPASAATKMRNGNSEVSSVRPM